MSDQISGQMSGAGTAPTPAHERIMAAAARVQARGEITGRWARDPVNQPTINNWVEAMGDTNARWRSGEAPPAMMQVWTMYGQGGERDPDDPLHLMMGVLDEAGYAAVLGTNSEQTYVRTLHVGEQLRVTSALDGVAGPKQTAIGEGYFVTSRSTWYVGSEQVASMLFRVLKFKPALRKSASSNAEGERFVLRPMRNLDTEFFWQGTSAGELRIQKCNGCGELRHPPGPACPSCGALDRGWSVASGEGSVSSFVVHRHPPVPGRELPIVIGLVDLAEGVRMVGELAGVLPEEAAIGMPVHVCFDRIDDDLTLPVWRRS